LQAIHNLILLPWLRASESFAAHSSPPAAPIEGRQNQNAANSQGEFSMLDTFRKRDNSHPPTPQQPASRIPPAAGSAPGAAPTPRTDSAPAKPMLLDPAALPALTTGAQSSAAASSAAQPAPAEATQEQPASSARLVVGPEIKLRGAEITDCDTIIVEGEVDASMDSRVVEIAQQGVFRGKVEVDVAEIRGRFEGELTAHKRLVIRETGRVAGKIRYGKVCIDEGGELSGDIAAADAPSERGARAEARAARATANALASK
jgi:cytoskeletal protein CcmA (bactofilin family)